MIEPHVSDPYTEMIRLHEAIGNIAWEWTYWYIQKPNIGDAARYPAPCCIGRARKGEPCMNRLVSLWG